MTGPDYAKLYHQAACGLLTTSIAGVVTDVNDTLLGWTGYRASDLEGRSFTHLLDAGSQIFYETRHAQTLHLRGQLKEVALTLRRADGSRLSVLMNSVVMAGEDPPVVRTAIFDATDRLEYESELLQARRSAESSEARVRILQDVSSTFGVSVSDEDVAQAFTDVARDAFSAVETAVLLRDDDGVLQVVAGANPLAETVPPIEALRNTPLEIAVHADEADSTYPTLAAGLRQARLESLSITPLLNDTERLGLLVCFFARRREFDEQFFDLQRALGRQASQTLLRVRLQRQLEHLALHDPLTGLANRELLQRSLEAAIEQSQHAEQPLTLVFFDVDDFKSVNDRWGHRAGDAVLRELADRLRSGVRSGDVVGRIGGDEFIVICAGADREAAATIADRILVSSRAPVMVDGVALSVSMSAGVATYVPDQHSGLTGDQLLIRADGAMYQSKGSGKDRVTLDTGV
ncbi:diguanylate cyclase [Microbacterium pumilum]|uniref:GGDEF domain-containing protein n=1 Tax=Microbacterium pumilum TaxID=344165 RepID=A0ABN2S568_9MICO